MEPSLGKEVKRRSWRRTLAHACRKRTRHIRSKTRSKLCRACSLPSPQYTDRRPRQRSKILVGRTRAAHLTMVCSLNVCVDASAVHSHHARKQLLIWPCAQNDTAATKDDSNSSEASSSSSWAPASDAVPRRANLSHQFGLESADKSLRRSEHNRRDTGKILKKNSLSLPAASFSSSR